jgi:DNA polymerase
MKRSQLSKVTKLIKKYVEEEKEWGETEFVKPKRAQQKVKIAAGMTLEELHKTIQGCRKCPLGKSRLTAVPGDGNPKAKLLFIGEGPGFDEDHQGLPFIGRAGQLLTKIIEAMGLKRSDVFIANIVKCHPMIDPSDPEKRGNDRPPQPEEVEACTPYLDAQIDIIKPQFICLLGGSATKALLKIETGISKVRGEFREYRGVPVMPTYHPAALLRDPSLKKDVWNDMKKLMSLMKE